MQTIKSLVDEKRIPWVFKVPGEINRVVVHADRFHSDDVMCVALLKETHDENIEIIRLKRNESVEAFTDYRTIICDVGMEYDGELLFDHHQLPSAVKPSQLRSAVGLIWDRYGNPIYNKVSAMIHDIDKHDCNSVQYRSQLCVTIGNFNPRWDSPDSDFDENFLQAVEFCRIILRTTVLADCHCMAASAMVANNNDIENGVMFLTTDAPYEQCMNKYPSVKMVARERADGTYICRCVNRHTFEKKVLEQPLIGTSVQGWVVTAQSRRVVETLGKHTYYMY